MDRILLAGSLLRPAVTSRTMARAEKSLPDVSAYPENQSHAHPLPPLPQPGRSG